jgi:hypothetical protein
MKHFLNEWWVVVISISVSVISISGALMMPPTPTKNSVNVSGMDGHAEVKMITLPDGTRCAILVGPYKGAVDCDWK